MISLTKSSHFHSFNSSPQEKSPDNTLAFSFPETNRQLRDLCMKHADKLARHFAGEDPACALEEYLKDVLTRTTPKEDMEEYKSRSLALLTKLSLADITKAVVEFTQSEMEFPAEDSTALKITFERTLRIPDDDKTYPLPPSLGEFPLVHVDDYARALPTSWRERGGVMLPMYQAEALWLMFDAEFPCAVKIGAGKINAVSGKDWTGGLSQSPQDYLVTPEQPWLDGWCVEKGIIRQFVAMPLGGGHSVEEQLSGNAEWGGIQIQVYPLRADILFKERFRDAYPKKYAQILDLLLPAIKSSPARYMRLQESTAFPPVMACLAEPSMGLGAGGKMRQEIYQDRRKLSDWNTAENSRCFVHLCDSMQWREITGELPPACPVTAREYENAGLPWFDHYDEKLTALAGAHRLTGIKSVSTMAKEQGQAPLAGNNPVSIPKILDTKNPRPTGLVREWRD